MGKRWRRLRAMKIVSQVARGKEDGFRKLVSELADEDIEDFLRQLDTAMAKKERVGLNPAVQMEYAILGEERRRREDGRQEAGE